ncbi:Late embryogenesis abundant protein Lea5 [Apostasia shenzhenica]|uniref:Late embryogenesis abundant protein Lea5 n=1 Tax=Apostasia shenzhenica TaxID=1088818 RepID=A0A2I0A605_9ASPA|nr:Late embryogenesis abundant protein Lea5 [Apostasia shenzhenica]
MARAICSGRALVTALSDGISSLTSRRGFSAASAAGRGMLAEEKAVMMKGKNDAAALGSDSAAASAWVPDPVTGCYRPANRVRDIDPAELRLMLLKTKA